MALIPWFHGETSGGVWKSRLFSQATFKFLFQNVIISMALIPWFHGETSGGVWKSRLFSQATFKFLFQNVISKRCAWTSLKVPTKS